MPPASENAEIRDTRALRALAHPLRWKLLDLLSSEEMATATRCAEVLGESVASCAYHLNILAKYRFVEKAGIRQGREKPWRVTAAGQNWTPDELDAEGALAAEAATEVFLEHEFTRTKSRLRKQSGESLEWRRASRVTGITAVLTAEEFQALGEEIAAIAYRYADRSKERKELLADAREVRIFFVTSVTPRSSSRQ